MYLLDTNIVSMLDPRRHEQAPALIEWLERKSRKLARCLELRIGDLAPEND